MTMAFFFLIHDDVYFVLVSSMLLADVLMIISLIAGYDSGMARFLPFRKFRQEKSDAP